MIKEKQNSVENQNWKEIHEDFSEELDGKTYQLLWEQENLTYQDAQEWIPVGFNPNDCQKAKGWKIYNFTPEEVKSWIEIGLDKDDVAFVAYLKLKSCQPNPNLNLEQLREEFDSWKENPSVQNKLINERLTNERIEYSKTKDTLTNIQQQLLAEQQAKTEAETARDDYRTRYTEEQAAHQETITKLTVAERERDKVNTAKDDANTKLAAVSQQLTNEKNNHQETKDKLTSVEKERDTANTAKVTAEQQRDQANTKLTTEQNNHQQTKGDLTATEKTCAELQEKLNDAEDLVRRKNQILQKNNLLARNIILIGYTGSGKSTLGNVLINRNNNFEGVFEVSDYGVSKTKHTKEREFEDNERGIKYNVIDTIGVGDTELSSEKVTEKIAGAAYSVRYGLNQVLFVVKGRFTDQEKLIYDMLKKTIFGENIDRYITIVCTGFSGYDDLGKCEENKKLLENSNVNKNAEIISAIKKIIHIDSPSPNNHISFETIKKIKEECRKILLDHLADCEEVYKPQNLLQIKQNLEKERSKIESYLIDKKIQKELKQKASAVMGKLTEKIEREIEKEKKVFDEVERFLEAKKFFLNARQSTIEGLQKCYNELAKQKKESDMGEVSKVVSSIGEISLTFGIPKALGGLIDAVNNTFKKDFSKKSIEAFQQYLTNDDKEILPYFDKFYNSLIKSLKENKDLTISPDIKDILELENKIWNIKTRLFSTDYKVYDVTGFWEEKPLDSTNETNEMKEIIISLSKNLKELRSELEQEERQIRKLSEKLKQNQQYQASTQVQPYNINK